MVCHADSFFIGRPVPALAINDELMLGQTYFVLPIDRFACSVLSASTLATLGSSSRPNKKAAPINFGERPFEYIKGSNGKVLIKVVPEFIARLIARSHKEIDGSSEAISSVNTTFLCSTPELQKHYEQLVVSKEQLWSPKLETISEYKVRFSPCKYIGLEWKEKEQEVI
ncbi:hypothetical protein DVH24_003818 [Malus domestica]|uniref:Uncharacterized protein n=1 Tax=Malus domestica TaxID=3750 RepID=A0A498K6Z7_MALDO|nr:hypothetical protein DVH24_003818 [Malus domestica]